MFGQHSFISKGALVASALLVLAVGPVLAAPGYAPGYFSSQHGGYFPGYYGGHRVIGGYYPGYFSHYPAGYPGYGGYYPGYFSDLHNQSTYPPITTPYAHYYSPATVESSGGRSVLPEVHELQSLDPSQTGGGAVISVHVPADAEVWFDGAPTKQRGAERDYTTPPMPVGRLNHYQVRARWKKGGRVVDQTRTVPVAPTIGQWLISPSPIRTPYSDSSRQIRESNGKSADRPRRSIEASTPKTAALAMDRALHDLFCLSLASWYGRRHSVIHAD